MATRAGAAAAAVLWLAIGCGGDDDGGTGDGDGDGAGADAALEADARAGADAAQEVCGGAGSSQVSGTVGGQMIDPVASSWSRQHPTFAYAHLITLDEDPASSCAQTDGDVGQRLMFIFCDPPAAGEYDVVDLEALPEEACPGELVVGALAEDADGGDLDRGTAGTVTVAATEGCVTGSFEVTMETGTLDGDFAATACE